MAFYDDNELSGIGGNIHVEAAEGYSGTIGAQMLMVEGFQNDMDMFTASILSDRKEYRMVKEGAGEDELATVQEGALSSFWGKIKTFIEKLIAKIKGIFKGFIAKFEAWMGRDGKAFFEKYKKDIFSGKDLDGLKVKYSAPKIGLKSIVVDVTSASPKNDISDDKTTSDLVDDYLGAITTPKVSGASKGAFSKDFHEACFDSEESGHEVKSGSVAEYVKFISGKEDLVDTVKKMATTQEKGLNAYLKQIEKYQGKAVDYAVDSSKSDHTKVSNTFDGKGGNVGVAGKWAGSASDAQKHAACLQKQASAMQEALGVANSAALASIKFAVAQSRRIAASIVAFRGKKHEDTDLLLIEAEQEAAEYEVMSALEAVY